LFLLGTNAILNGKYTTFARVVDGMVVLDAIENAAIGGEIAAIASK
jgi:cyclophilin family peptidyl-prolyl cis-trans isomerase